MRIFDQVWKTVLFYLLIFTGCCVCGYFIGLSQTIQPVSIGFIFIVVLLIFSKDFAAYLFLFLLFPFKTLLNYFFEDQVIAAIIRDGLLALMTMKVFYDVALTRKQFLPSPISFPVFAFIGYSTAYLLGTEKGFIAVIDFRSKILYMAMLFLTVHYIDSRDRLMKTLYMLIGISFIISLLGVMQQIFGVEGMAKFGFKARFGFKDTGEYIVAQEHIFSNALVGGLIPSAKIAIYFSLCLLHYRKKLPLLITIALTGIVGLFFSFSRSAFITMIAGIIWLSLFTKWKKLVIITCISVFAFFTLSTGWVYDRFEDIFHPFSNTSFVGRVYSYIYALKAFRQLAFGTGFGRVGGALKSWDAGTTTTDTYYVTIFMTIGFPGFLIFMWIGVTLFIKGLLIVLKMRDPFFKLVAIGAYTYVCQQYIAIVAIDSFHTLPTAFYFWVCVGLLFALQELDSNTPLAVTEEVKSTDSGNLVPVVNPS